MPAQIAILGWGSLLWDTRPEFDEQHEPWRHDGPEINVEFSRVSQSRRGALTLVIDPKNGAHCRVAYAISKRRDPEDAICDLRCREGTTRSNIGFLFADGSRRQGRDPHSLEAIRAWAETKKLDVVVWTDLGSNFDKVYGKPFDIDAALAHIQSLDGEAKSGAAEYVWRAPGFVDTPLRRVLQTPPWFSKSGTDCEFLQKLRAHAAQTRAFLSNKMKPERERSVCRAFLRSLGVSFSDSELVAPTVEPADVAFRDARFQVRDLLRERKRGDDWRKNEKQFAEAQSIADLGQPYSPPVPIDLKSLVPEVAAALSEKATKYGTGCKDLDALIYVDLKDTFLEANSLVPSTAELEHQRWRSVPLLFSPYGVVLVARTDAPAFLRGASGKTSMKWEDIDTLFEARL